MRGARQEVVPVGEPEQVKWVLVGSSLAAVSAGALACLFVVRSVVETGELLGEGLFSVGAGAFAFLVLDGLWTRGSACAPQQTYK